MPKNKKESLIFTLMMCAVMASIMSLYNITLYQGFSLNTIKTAIIGFPLIYIVAMTFEILIVSKIVKIVSSKIIKEDDKQIKNILVISLTTIIGMVVLMSLFGAIAHPVNNVSLINLWLENISKNFIMALPLQLLIAGPLVRSIFKKLYN